MSKRSKFQKDARAKLEQASKYRPSSANQRTNEGKKSILTITFNNLFYFIRMIEENKRREQEAKEKEREREARFFALLKVKHLTI